MAGSGGGRIVVAHADRAAQRALQRHAGASLCPVTVVGDASALIAAMDADAIGVVDASIALARPELHELPGRAWIAVPGAGAAPAAAAAIDALLAAGWRHVVAHAMPILAEELLATIQKLQRRDVFGLEKYVAWGAAIASHAIADAAHRDDAVAAIARDVAAVGLPERIGSLVSVIADELLANAIYTAPIDDTGARPRRGEPRDRARALTGRDAVSLRWATDARYVAIEVRDAWGSLDPTAIARRLAATAKPASNAGGMGLPLVYACCNQLAIGVEPGAATEVIALLDVRYEPADLARSASFHVFTA